VNTLFPIEPNAPAGFTYREEFISVDEELQLVEILKALEPRPMNFLGYEAKRKVASFGFDYSFEKRTLSKGKEIPDQFDFLLQRVASYFDLNAKDIAELLVTEYPPRSVINWHRDAPPFDIIFGISLLSDCLFRFRPYDKNLQGRKSIISLPAKRRSIYLMQGEARSAWEHSISPVKSVRYSITLRTLRQLPGA
jgi:alkylated DNA repair dioxygenase AlkB